MTDCFFMIKISILGSGDFGSVYKARNKLDGIEYAIKKIYFKKNSTDSPTRVIIYRIYLRNLMSIKFYVLNEIKLLSSLYHPNIVNYHNCWIEHALEPEKLHSDTQFTGSQETTYDNELNNYQGEFSS